MILWAQVRLSFLKARPDWSLVKHDFQSLHLSVSVCARGPGRACARARSGRAGSVSAPGARALVCALPRSCVEPVLEPSLPLPSFPARRLAHFFSSVTAHASPATLSMWNGKLAQSPLSSAVLPHLPPPTSSVLAASVLCTQAPLLCPRQIGHQGLLEVGAWVPTIRPWDYSTRKAPSGLRSRAGGRQDQRPSARWVSPTLPTARRRPRSRWGYGTPVWGLCRAASSSGLTGAEAGAGSISKQVPVRVWVRVRATLRLGWGRGFVPVCRAGCPMGKSAAGRTR